MNLGLRRWQKGLLKLSSDRRKWEWGLISARLEKLSMGWAAIFFYRYHRGRLMSKGVSGSGDPSRPESQWFYEADVEILYEVHTHPRMWTSKIILELERLPAEELSVVMAFHLKCLTHFPQLLNLFPGHSLFSGRILFIQCAPPLADSTLYLNSPFHLWISKNFIRIH